MNSPSSRSPSPDRPPIRRYRRLVGWDYSKGASFFIKIATEPRRSLFGKVEKGARIAFATPGGMAVHAVPKGGGVAYLPGET